MFMILLVKISKDSVFLNFSGSNPFPSISNIFWSILSNNIDNNSGLLPCIISVNKSKMDENKSYKNGLGLKLLFPLFSQFEIRIILVNKNRKKS